MINAPQAHADPVLALVVIIIFALVWVLISTTDERPPCGGGRVTIGDEDE